MSAEPAYANVEAFPTASRRAKWNLAMDMMVTTRYSPEQIAHRCGITVKTLQKWERNPIFKRLYDEKVNRILDMRRELELPFKERYNKLREKSLEAFERRLDHILDNIEDADAREIEKIAAFTEDRHPDGQFRKVTKQENKTTHEHFVGGAALQQINQLGHQIQQQLGHEAIPVTAEVIEPDEEEGEDEASD